MNTSVLDKEVHKHILDDLERYASIAGISTHMLGTSVNGYLKPHEIEWLRGIKLLLKNGEANYCFTGTGNKDISTKMMAITGCLMRNFIDAWMMSLMTVVEDDELAQVPTVLLIPDFHSVGAAESGKPLAPWQLTRLHGLLLNRLSDNKGTIIYTSDFKKVRECYGSGIDGLIRSHYKLGE